MDYSKIAPVYQLLSRLVFGKTLINAQLKALTKTNLGGKLLICGGGDGEILKHLQFFKGEITFLELSAKMIDLARKKTDRNITFANTDFFNFQPSEKYDVILLPFLLDNFSELQMQLAAQKLASLLATNGEIWVIDFTETPNFWQRSLMFLMYSFFKVVANVKVNKLPAIEMNMNNCGFLKVDEIFFYGRFIEAKRYIRA